MSELWEAFRHVGNTLEREKFIMGLNCLGTCGDYLMQQTEIRRGTFKVGQNRMALDCLVAVRERGKYVTGARIVCGWW